MIKRCFLFLIGLAVVTAEAFDLVVPKPEKMLAEANLVAVAHISKTTPYFELEVDEILKGDLHVGDRRSISSPFPPMAFSLQSFGNLIGNERFLFVGEFDAQAGVVYPSFAFGSAWPQGDVKKRLLPSDSLDECVRFARERGAANGLGQPEAPPRRIGGTNEPSPERASGDQLSEKGNPSQGHKAQSAVSGNSGSEGSAPWWVLSVSAIFGVATAYLVFLIRRRGAFLKKWRRRSQGRTEPFDLNDRSGLQVRDAVRPNPVTTIFSNTQLSVCLVPFLVLIDIQAVGSEAQYWDSFNEFMGQNFESVAVRENALILNLKYHYMVVSDGRYDDPIGWKGKGYEVVIEPGHKIALAQMEGGMFVASTTEGSRPFFAFDLGYPLNAGPGPYGEESIRHFTAAEIVDGKIVEVAEEKGWPLLCRALNRPELPPPSRQNAAKMAASMAFAARKEDQSGESNNVPMPADAGIHYPANRGTIRYLAIIVGSLLGVIGLLSLFRRLRSRNSSR